MYKNMIKELKGKDIITAYNGDHLSQKFGYSCANFNCDYQKRIDMNLFDLYTENINNISCFVYIENNKIEGRRMFFKGKQLLDHEIFPINTTLNEEIYYLYGYYGSNEQNNLFDNDIINYVINKYGENKIIYMDYGYYDNKIKINNKSFWIMQIENMNYKKFPSIDFLYASSEINSFSNFKPSHNIREWLSEKYTDKKIIDFGLAYNYEHHTNDNVNKHWNQKSYKKNNNII